MMTDLTVTSEIYEEYDYTTKMKPKTLGNIVSEFSFYLPSINCGIAKFDMDNDLDVERPKREVIKIEHSPKTNLSLVGLQVWRGAFLLADLLIHLGLNGHLLDKCVLELGAGTGLTSVVAAMFANKVICTDMNVGGILELIKLNANYNARLIKSQFKVLALDFKNTMWNQKLSKDIESVNIVLAADVVYDDDVTAAFVTTLIRILSTKPPKTVYVALEKRYVFTLEHMDSVAPCYETFLGLLDKIKTSENGHSKWIIQQMPLDFPKYFLYDRVKELVLWKISSL